MDVPMRMPRFHQPLRTLTSVFALAIGCGLAGGGTVWQFQAWSAGESVAAAAPADVWDASLTLEAGRVALASAALVVAPSDDSLVRFKTALRALDGAMAAVDTDDRGALIADSDALAKWAENVVVSRHLSSGIVAQTASGELDTLLRAGDSAWPAAWTQAARDAVAALVGAGDANNDAQVSSLQRDFTQAMDRAAAVLDRAGVGGALAQSVHRRLIEAGSGPGNPFSVRRRELDDIRQRSATLSAGTALLDRLLDSARVVVEARAWESGEHGRTAASNGRRGTALLVAAMPFFLIAGLTAPRLRRPGPASMPSPVSSRRKEISTFSPADLVEDVVGSRPPDGAHERPLVDIEAGVPEMVAGDVARARAALWTLIGAAQPQKDGPAILRVSLCAGSEPTRPTLRFEVTLAQAMPEADAVVVDEDFRFGSTVGADGRARRWFIAAFDAADGLDASAGPLDGVDAIVLCGDFVIRGVLARRLEAGGASVREAGDEDDARELLADADADAVVVRIGKDGILSVARGHADRRANVALNAPRRELWEAVGDIASPPVLDGDHVRTVFGGDAAEMLATFVRTSWEPIEALIRAGAEQTRTLNEDAHRLAGAARMAGATRLAETLMHFERVTAQGKRPETADRQNLERILAQTLAAIAGWTSRNKGNGRKSV